MIHRDLKTLNLLLKGEKFDAEAEPHITLKIGDFGMCRQYSIAGNNPFTNQVCTRIYRAPELLLLSNFYSTGVDAWSIGCIIAEMIIGNCLFRVESDIEMLKVLFSVFGIFTEEMLPGLNFFGKFSTTEKVDCLGLKNYIKSRCKMKVSEKLFDLLEKMLVIDPTKRIC